MSYIALARKWRPRQFSQLIGQEHVNKALIHSLNQNRIHHAYLFTGTRGVGKTSIARLFAKALNCEQGVSAEPCLKCHACMEIEQGRFIDLIEIDGASRTRVEDTREVLENVQYAPTQGRFKIYLIDEVHMLSQHSFNALLKTLEEPPEHVKFLLATTEQQKLPITVLSRCLQFNLHSISAEIIHEHLGHIVKEEKIAYDDPALALIANAAHGSIRDALSLLDQAIASCNQQLDITSVKICLGYTQQDFALQILQALAQEIPDTLIAISRKIAIESGHFHYVADELLRYLHDIALYQAMPDSSLLSFSPARSVCDHFTPEHTQLLYQIVLKGLADIHLAPTPAIGFDMMLLRMYAFKPAPPSPVPPLAHDSVTPLSKSTMTPEAIPNSAEPIVIPAVTKEPSVTEDWGHLLKALQLSGLALNAAEQAEFVSHTDTLVTLRIDEGHRSLFTPAVIKRIEQALTKYYEKSISLNLNSDEKVISSPRQQKQKMQENAHHEATASLKNDPFFQQLQDEFSAELVKNSIASLKDSL